MIANVRMRIVDFVPNVMGKFCDDDGRLDDFLRRIRLVADGDDDTIAVN